MTEDAGLLKLFVRFEKDSNNAFEQYFYNSLSENKTFSTMIEEVIKEYNVTKPKMFTDKTRLNRNIYYDLKKEITSFKTIVSICVGLNLSLEKSVKLLESKGFSFIPKNEIHEEYKSMIANHNLRFIMDKDGKITGNRVDILNTILDKKGFSKEDHLGSISHNERDKKPPKQNVYSAALLKEIIKKYKIYYGSFQKETNLETWIYERISNGSNIDFKSIIALCIGYNIDINDSIQLLESMGYTFIPTNRLHQAYKYLIEICDFVGLVEKKYNIEIITTDTKNKIYIDDKKQEEMTSNCKMPIVERINLCNGILDELGFNEADHLGSKGYN